MIKDSNNNIIIGFIGKKGSGKTTIANYIKNQLIKSKNFNNNDIIIMNFADSIKQCLKIIFDFSDEELYGNKKEELDKNWNIIPRDIMQYYATELMRYGISEKYPEIGTNIWVKSLENKINKLHNKIILIADVRFKNECEMIIKHNGIIIKIIRNSCYSNNKFCNHKSEKDLDDYNFDFYIKNNIDLTKI